MTIYQRQFSQILSEELLRQLLEGKVPDVATITDKVSKALSKDGNITYQFFQQPSRSLFQIEQYNTSLKQIKFDIDMLQDELLDLFSSSVKRISYADMYHKVHSHELKNLKSILTSILFTIENADFYFSGAFDNFSDNSKADLEESTPQVINSSETCLNLPFGGRNTQRIDSSHLQAFDTWPIEVVTPKAAKILFQEQVPGSRFSSMFVDNLSAWSYEIVTTERVPVSIRFTFPLAGSVKEDVEVLISRIEIMAHSLGKQKIRIRLSTDNVNYLAPLGYEDGIEVTDLKSIFAMDFETNLVQFVEVVLSKEGPDQVLAGQSGDAFQYVFGLKGLAAYQTGRQRLATYVSKPFAFNEQTSISKVSIQSNFFKPPGTNIRYSLALADADGNQASSFFAINPVGKSVQASAPDVVKFDTSNTKQERFSVDLSKTEADLRYGQVFRGKNLYKIKDSLSPAPLFNSINLTRGFGAWSRDTSVEYIDITVPNCYVDFSSGDDESLYLLTSETKISGGPFFNATYDTPSALFSNTQFITQNTNPEQEFILSERLYFDPNRGHQLRALTPNSITPRGAIHSVKHIQGSTRRTLAKQLPILFPSTTGDLLFFTIDVTNFITATTDPVTAPIVRAYPVGSSTAQVLNIGVDYILSSGVTLPDGVRVETADVRMAIPATSWLRRLLSPASVGEINAAYTIEIEYSPLEDITLNAFAYDAGQNMLTLSNTIVPFGEALLITYRHKVKVPDEIIKTSVEVYDLPTIDPNKTKYVEGVDYTISARTGLITRIATGGITAAGGVYVNFIIRRAGIGIERFNTWCHVENPDGVEIRFELNSESKVNRLIPDTAAGEDLFVNTPAGSVNLTRSAGTPVIGPGWVQFMVISKNPFINRADPGASRGAGMIDQVIQINDLNGRKVFRGGGAYFDTILAFREPMIQRTLGHFRTNTLATNKETFAIDDSDPQNAVVVVNYLANMSDDIYNYSPTEDGDRSLAPQAFPETYDMSWSYINTDSATLNNKLLVRINLERDLGVDGSLTPKIFDYQVRVGF